MNAPHRSIASDALQSLRRVAPPGERRRAAAIPLFGALLIALGGVGCDRESESAGLGPEARRPEALVEPALRIEEICPANLSLLDETGEDPGWVEIANRSTGPVSLGAWRLRGEADDGPGWRLPDTTLAAGMRMVVFMSGHDIRSARAAGDTISVFNTADAIAWADSQGDPAGHSTWRPWELDSLTGKLPDGRNAISAELVLADKNGTLISTSVAWLLMRFPKAVRLSSGRNILRLRATIPAGQTVQIKLCRDSAACQSGSTVVARGTGEPLGLYHIPLFGLLPEYSQLYGLRFEAPRYGYGTYRYTISSAKFYRATRFPHASFTLDRDGSILTLEDTAGLSRQHVAYPEVPPGASWAVSADDGQWGVRLAPSPGTPTPSGPPATQLPSPPFATAPGFYPTGPLVVQVARVPGTVVRCALGGSMPTTSSPGADTGIRLDSSAVVRCAAFGADGARGPVSTGTFFLGEEVHLPVVALAADPGALFDSDTGMYMAGANASPVRPYQGANFWKDIELPAQIELFEGGRRSFGLAAGIAIHGAYSRSNAKKSIAVNFRESYGPRHLDWPLFPAHPELRRFKAFVLRNNGNNFGKEHFRDVLMTSLTEGRGIEHQYARLVAVFINGRYWGIHDLREKLDPHYIETRFGIDPASIDMLENWSAIQAGTLSGWGHLKSALDAAIIPDSLSWERIASQIDVDNYADYVGSEIYFANIDWPMNNTRSWRTRTPAGRWRMILFDTDHGYGSAKSAELDMFSYLLSETGGTVAGWTVGPYSTLLFRRLAAYPEWRRRFTNRLAVQLSTNFAPSRVQRAIDSLAAIVEPELPRECLRWNLSTANIQTQYQHMREFASARPGHLRGQMRAAFGLGADAPLSLLAAGGAITVEGLDVGEEYHGIHFAGNPLRLTAVAGPGRIFVRWSDGVTSAERMVTPDESGIALVAEFR